MQKALDLQKKHEIRTGDNRFAVPNGKIYVSYMSDIVSTLNLYVSTIRRITKIRRILCPPHQKPYIIIYKNFQYLFKSTIPCYSEHY